MPRRSGQPPLPADKIRGERRCEAQRGFRWPSTKAVARPKRGAAEGSTVPKSRLIKTRKKEKTQPYRAESFAIHRWSPLFPFRTCSIPTPLQNRRPSLQSQRRLAQCESGCPRGIVCLALVPSNRTEERPDFCARPLSRYILGSEASV